MLVFCIVGLDLGSNANLTNFKAKIYPPVLCFWHLYYGVYFMEYGKDSSLISSKKLGFPSGSIKGNATGVAYPFLINPIPTQSQWN